MMMPNIPQMIVQGGQQPMMNGDAANLPPITIQERAQSVLNYLDKVALDLATSPDLETKLALLGPESEFANDIVRLCHHVLQQPNTAAQQPHANQYQQPHQQQPMEQAQPSSGPVTAHDVQTGFINAMRSNNVIPGASDLTTPPGVVASLVRVYFMGRMDEVKRLPGGWKAVEALTQQLGYIMQPTWQPDQSWKWWAAPAAPPPAYRQAGANPMLAAMMAQPAGW